MVAAVALVAAGCGSSTPLTKAEFVKQGNQICAAAQKERQEATSAATKGEGSGGGKEGEEVVLALVAPVQQMSEELGDLSAPEGQEKKVEAIVAAFEAGVAKVESEPQGSGLATAFKKADKLAEGYGLTACAI